MNIPIAISPAVTPPESDNKGKAKVSRDASSARDEAKVNDNADKERGKGIEEKAVPNVFEALMNRLAAQSDVELSSDDIQNMYAQIAENGKLDSDAAGQLQSMIDNMPAGSPFAALFALAEEGELIDQMPEGGLSILQGLAADDTPIRLSINEEGIPVISIDGESMEMPAASQASVPSYMIGDDIEGILPDMRLITSVNKKGADFLEKMASQGLSSDIVMTDEEVMALHKALNAIASKIGQNSSEQARMQQPQDAPGLEMAVAANSAMSGKWFESTNGIKRLGVFGDDIAADTRNLVTANAEKTAAPLISHAAVQQAAMPQQPDSGLGNQAKPTMAGGILGASFSSEFAQSGDIDFTTGLDDIKIQIVNTAQSAPQSVAAVHHMGVTAPATPAGQIVAAALSKTSLQDGSQRLAVSLNPPELGRVIADIEMDAKNKIKVNITVEKEAAFHMLQRDQALLEQALHKAGLDFDSADLQFSFNEGHAFDQAFENPKHLAGDGAKGGNGEGAEDNIADIAEISMPQGEYVDLETGMTRYHAVV